MNPDDSAKLHQNQPYDESLEVPDSEEVASNYTPSPRVPFHGDLGRSRGNTPPDSRMDDNSDDDLFDTGQGELAPGRKDSSSSSVEDFPPPKPRGGGALGAIQPLGPAQGHGGNPKHPSVYTDEDDDEDGSESSEEDDDDDEGGAQLEGAYDPADYEHLPVTPEIKELFQYITRYTPQSIELENKLKPFIPDFIPSVGDIDAFIKVHSPRTDGKADMVGLTVLDEPCAKQSDPTVLDLQLRSISKQTNLKAMVVRSVDDAEKNPKAIDNWIESISELHRSRPPPNVHYTKNMPDIDTLMQEWPEDFEELLKEVGLPTADLDCDLAQYVDIICSLLDIPIYKSKIQSLHVLLTLYSEFKNSQHFKALAEENKLDNALKGMGGGGGGMEGDQLIL